MSREFVVRRERTSIVWTPHISTCIAGRAVSKDFICVSKHLVGSCVVNWKEFNLTTIFNCKLGGSHSFF